MIENYNLTPKDAIELIYYDRICGTAWHNLRDVRWFLDNGDNYTAQRVCKWWNSRFAGKEIKTISAGGYISCKILGVTMPLHRFVWFRETGEWPDCIDHINGIRTDNRWCNLRNVTKQENNRNAKLRKDNSTGYQGIDFMKKEGKFRARILGSNTGNSIYLGLFDSLEEAIVARKAAEIEHGFCENHGRTC